MRQIKSSAVSCKLHYEEEVTLMLNICHISSEDFLEDVKAEIKKQFKNQDNFAASVYLSRKQLNRILNNADELTVRWISEFCEKLDLDLRNYLF